MGISTTYRYCSNDSNKTFFSNLIEENRLISLYDFENKEGLFDIHRMFKFCLLTVGQKQDNAREVSGGFYLTRLDHLLDPTRIYKLKTTDFELLNPNTKHARCFVLVAMQCLLLRFIAVVK